MSNVARFKLNLKSGEIEMEGTEQFVQQQIEGLAALVSALGIRMKQGAASQGAAGSGEEDVGDTSEIGEDEGKNGRGAQDGQDGPLGSFGEWMHSFRTELTDEDKALLTARYVQEQSPQKDFKTSEVNKALKEHGIRLPNPSRSIGRLAERKLMFQTRRVGKLKFMRVSVDGQAHVTGLRR